MADLSSETLTNIFNLQRRLWELINQTTTTSWIIFEQFGETEETIPELEALQNIDERLRDPYSRLYKILLQIAEAQPLANSAILNLLAQTIAQAEVTVEAANASIQEIKRSWNLQ